MAAVMEVCGAGGEMENLNSEKRVYRERIC